MFELLVLLGIGLAAYAVARPRRRPAPPPRDDTLRVGRAPDPSPYEAARRAEGKASWTRISGA